MNEQDQKKWERAMIDYGVARFRVRDEKAVQAGRFNEAFGGGRLMRSYLPQVSEHLKNTLSIKKRGKITKYAKMASMVDCDKLAMFALTLLVEAVYKENTVASVCRRLGQFVEDELKFSKFALDNPGYFNALTRDLDNKNSTSIRHRRNVLSAKMQDSGIEWVSWSQETAINVGMYVFNRSVEALDWITLEQSMSRGKKQNKIVATPEVMEWVQNSADATALLLPDRMPCLIPPLDWTSPTDGGYYTRRLRGTTPMVKVRWQPTRDKHNEILAEATMPKVYTAINAMQRTAWRVNATVLETMQAIFEKNLGTAMPASQPYSIPPCPDIPRKDRDAAEQAVLDNWKSEAREIYALEKKRQTQVLEVTRTMRIGQMLKDKPALYFVYQCDFRGRLYCATSGLSPQGADPSRATLEFKNGQIPDETGMYWLKVHGANKFGYDKASYDARVEWITSRHDEWVACGKDPVSMRSTWAEADKPWQFLAWCIDYARVDAGGASHTAVALDGSCNGLQHFSAMLRDPVGGSAVNLIPSETPADIYQEVADVATKKLQAIRESNSDRGVAAANWLSLFEKLGSTGMSRKLAKKPVMTLPYGSTQQACTSSVFAWLMQEAPDYLDDGSRFTHCVFLSKILWDSIGEVVVAARAAMKWIQTCAVLTAAENLPLLYNTPLGFPVYQASLQAVEKRVSGMLGGSRLRVTINNYTDDINKAKMRQGSSPNLVHSVDATHLMQCVNAGAAEGITDFAMIHDDFGVLPNNVEKWHSIIRDQFIALHESTDVLQSFSDHLPEAVDPPEVPPKGSLDLSKVQESLYFFG